MAGHMSVEDGSLTPAEAGQRSEGPGRTGGRKRRGTGRFAARKRSTTITAPANVTIIGHNSRTLEVVGCFVAMGMPVRVYTTSPHLEVQLAPYPGVTATLITDQYAQAPRDLPAGP